MEISIPDRNNQLVDINGNSYFYFCPTTIICLLEKQPCAQQTKTRETIIIQYYRHITPFVLQPITGANTLSLSFGCSICCYYRQVGHILGLKNDDDLFWVTYWLFLKLQILLVLGATKSAKGAIIGVLKYKIYLVFYLFAPCWTSFLFI